MSYVIAAYGVTIVALVGYGLKVARECSALSRTERDTDSQH